MNANEENSGEEPSPEFLELLEKTDWADLTPRLLAYTAYRLSRYGHAKHRLAKSESDFVQQAIVLALTGKRRFPFDKRVSLFAFLCMVVDSLVSHEAEKVARVALLSTDVFPEEGVEASLQLTLPSYEIESEIIARDEIDRFIESLDDVELRAYVQLRVYGDYTTAREYAQALGTTEAQILNLQRRLKRLKKRA